MAAKLLATSPFVGIAALVSLVALFAFYYKPFSQQRLFTVEELALYNGTDASLPIFLGILGSVFDVTKGKSHYGEGGGYNHFSGRDASRAFVSGNFTGDGLTDSLRGLSSTQGVEAKAARGAQLLEKQENEEAKQPGCNSRWSQDEGGEVWCDEGVPRLVQRPLQMALTGKMSTRCACFNEDQLDQPGLKIYEGCDYLAKTCRV
ncbi:membrane-associated progesterone-binding protein 4 isoform X2 [Pyrus x bretschneideri]|uniref:membrane-associated progesterone-binding protein 4 isoform X2 n=1 Tax=Pyrus x bretschneideri TaxID=225117 RepID=UPI00202FC73C|nr:membrane-associated progesterone-binding protein 4 isoform X2 [Pyrus x bretschneideri]